MHLGMNWGAELLLAVLSLPGAIALSWVFWFLLRRVVTALLLAMLAPLLLVLAAILWLNQRGIVLEGRVISKSETVAVWSNKDEGSTGWQWDRKLQYCVSFQPPGENRPREVWLRTSEAAFDQLQTGSPAPMRYLDFEGICTLWRGADYPALSFLEWLGEEKLFRILFIIWSFAVVCAWLLETRAGGVRRQLWAAAGFALWLGLGIHWWVLPWWKSRPDETWLREMATVRNVHQLDLNEFSPSSWVELSFVPAGLTDSVVALDQVDTKSVIGLGKGQTVEVKYPPAYPRAARITKAERTNSWKTLAAILGGLTALLAAFLLLRSLWNRYWNRKMAHLAHQKRNLKKMTGESGQGRFRCVSCGKLLASAAQSCVDCGKPGVTVSLPEGVEQASLQASGKVADAPASAPRRVSMGILMMIAALALGSWFLSGQIQKEKGESSSEDSLASGQAIHTGAVVPLRQGLTIVTAVSREAGDSESIKAIHSVTTEAVEMVLSSTLPNGNHLTVPRTIRREDLRFAHKYWLKFGSDEPEEFPGTTALGTSTEVLGELKSKGQSSFVCRPDDQVTLSGTIKRGQSTPVMIPVLVNNSRLDLPCVLARGTLDEVEAEFCFLDDPANPLTLRLQVGHGTMQVIKISYPVEGPAPGIEQGLKETGRTEVYGIYFDFGQATIRPESQPVLREISEILEKHPEWKLSVEGHTDNIGGDSDNLDLSVRRAAAVKQALVEQYEISAERLSTTGFGESRPKESNETLAGRARNRRVELAKQ